jgi:hypothetical protein
MSVTAAPSHRNLVSVVLQASAVFAGACLFGFIMLVGLFKSGFLATQIDIMFYRGVVLCGLAAIITIGACGYVGGRLGFANPRDAIAAGMLSLGLNLSFLVIAPVTVDRSVSVFILGYMDAAPDRVMSVDNIRDAFSDRYLGAFKQIERRMVEQTVSGNVVAQDGGFVLTDRGRGFIRTAKFIAWMFDADPRFVAQRVEPAKLATTK